MSKFVSTWKCQSLLNFEAIFETMKIHFNNTVSKVKRNVYWFRLCQL